MFPDEQSARRWFENQVMAEGALPRACGSVTTRTVPKETQMPYWCTDGGPSFSVPTGTVLERSKVLFRKWAYAVYISLLTSVKSVPL